jgi:hypothetical protein
MPPPSTDPLLCTWCSTKCRISKKNSFYGFFSLDAYKR